MWKVCKGEVSYLPIHLLEPFIPVLELIYVVRVTWPKSMSQPLSGE